MFREGYCPTCGIQTHTVKKSIISHNTRLQPISNTEVDNGQCKRCDMSTVGSRAQPQPSAPPLKHGQPEDFSIPIAQPVAGGSSFSDIRASSQTHNVPVVNAQVLNPTVDSNVASYSTADDHGLRFKDGNKWGTYHGNTVQQKRHGFGKIQYDDGSSYEGEWHWNKFHGRGTLYYATGPILECATFSMGVIEGGATYYYPDGRVDLRMYKKGEVVGEGAQWSKDRRTITKLKKGRPKNMIGAVTAANIASNLGLRVPT